MGYRRHRAGREEELALPGGWAFTQHSHPFSRTGLSWTCGVLFFLALTASACTKAPPVGKADPLELSIGVAEGNVLESGLGAPQLASMLALEGLTQIDADGRVLPRLAARWEWENDQRRLRVFLRPDVQFHDGTRLTAAVAARILKIIVDNPNSPRLYPSLAFVESVAAEGDFQLVFNLTDRSAFLPEDLSVLLKLDNNDVGTGPYRITKRERSEVVLERFDTYHSGIPAIRRVVIRPFDTLRTTWTSLLRGDVDMVTDVPPNSVEFVRSDDIQVVAWQRWYQYMLLFNSRRPPFKSPAVRRALNLAVDRTALIERVLNGDGTPAIGPLWPKYWAYDPSASTASSYDPAQAEALLDGAGFRMPARSTSAGLPPARLRFTCLVPERFSIWERIALEVQKSLFNIGVDMQVKVVPFGEFNTLLGEGRFSEGGFDAAIVDMISGPTPGRAYIFWRSAEDFQGANVFGYENADAERMFHVLRTNTNEAAVRTATGRLQRIFSEDPPALFLAWNERARAVRRTFTVHQDAGRDPLTTLWRWTPESLMQRASTQ